LVDPLYRGPKGFKGSKAFGPSRIASKPNDLQKKPNRDPCLCHIIIPAY
jgi:hypothetical protein